MFRSVLMTVGLAATLPAVTLVRYPYVENVGEDRATIQWATGEPGTGVVEYSAGGSAPRRVTARMREFLPAETGMVYTYYQFTADLTGLRSGAEYTYRARVNGELMLAPDRERPAFLTAGAGPFRFVAFGDSGQGTVAQRQIAARVNADRPSLVVVTGDVVYPNGAHSDYQAYYFEPYHGLLGHIPFFLTPGNHDYETNAAAPYLAIHSHPVATVPPADRGRYYSFDWGNVHFVSLDSNVPLTQAAEGTGAMLDWLEQDLARTSKFWKIVFYHHAPYTSGGYAGDRTGAIIRERIVPILDRYHVQLALNGHEHNYQRTVPLRGGTRVNPGEGTVYVTTGGGGAEPYPLTPGLLQAVTIAQNHYVRVDVDGARLRLQAIGVNGQLLDTFTLAPRPSLTVAGVMGAGGAQSFAPGSLVTLLGRNLSGEDARSPALPLLDEMAGASVSLNGQALPLVSVSAGRITAQLPLSLPRGAAQASLRLVNGNGSVTRTIDIEDQAPAIFTLTAAGETIPAVFHADGKPVTAQSPAMPGSVVTVQATGLGRVTGAFAAGNAPGPAQRIGVEAAVEVDIGGLTVDPLFAGLAEGTPGLYIVEVRVPPALGPAEHELRLIVNGRASNAVRLAAGAYNEE